MHAGVTESQSLPSLGALHLLRWWCSHSLCWVTWQRPGPRTCTRCLTWERGLGLGASVLGDVRCSIRSAGVSSRGRTLGTHVGRVGFETHVSNTSRAVLRETVPPSPGDICRRNAALPTPGREPRDMRDGGLASPAGSCQSAGFQATPSAIICHRRLRRTLRTGDQSDLLIGGAQNLQVRKANLLCPSNPAVRERAVRRTPGLGRLA